MSFLCHFCLSYLWKYELPETYTHNKLWVRWFWGKSSYCLPCCIRRIDKSRNCVRFGSGPSWLLCLLSPCTSCLQCMLRAMVVLYQTIIILIRNMLVINSSYHDHDLSMVCAHVMLKHLNWKFSMWCNRGSSLFSEQQNVKLILVNFFYSDLTVKYGNLSVKQTYVFH